MLRLRLFLKTRETQNCSQTAECLDEATDSCQQSNARRVREMLVLRAKRTSWTMQRHKVAYYAGCPNDRTLYIKSTDSGSLSSDA